ncbi:TetR family transcriptional regulator, partial [Methylobacterium radiotolerans]
LHGGHRTQREVMQDWQERFSLHLVGAVGQAVLSARLPRLDARAPCAGTPVT